MQDEGSAAAGSCGELATPSPGVMNTRMPLAAAEGRSGAWNTMHSVINSNPWSMRCCGGLRPDDEQGMHCMSVSHDEDGDHSDTSSDAAARASGLGSLQHSLLSCSDAAAGEARAQHCLDAAQTWTVGEDAGSLLPSMATLLSSCCEPPSTHQASDMPSDPMAWPGPPVSRRMGGAKRRRSDTPPHHESKAKAPRPLRLHMTPLHSGSPSTSDQIAIDCNLNPAAWLPFCGDSHGLAKQRVATAPA